MRRSLPNLVPEGLREAPSFSEKETVSFLQTGRIAHGQAQFLYPQHPAEHLAGASLGQFIHEFHLGQRNLRMKVALDVCFDLANSVALMR